MPLVFPGLVRLGLIGAASATALLLLAPTASAHVHVVADNTVAGSDSALSFRVPNESDTAGTVGFRVLLPQDKPFLSVSVKPLPGWRASMREAPLPKPVVYEGTTLTKAVRTVTWAAEGGTRIGPGQYQEFSLAVEPLPGPGTVTIPAIQTYSDGTAVRWDQPTSASGEEPEHPAPQFTVTAPESGRSATPAAGSAPSPGVASSSTEASAPTKAAVPKSDTVGRWLGGAALVVAAVALGVAGFGLRRPRGSGPA